MTDFKLLQKKINESGLSIATICREAKILRETLYNRMRGKGEFKASEIAALAEVLKLSPTERDAIFFCKTA